MFCAPKLDFGRTYGVVGPRFHVLHFWTRFRRFRGRWVQFLFFCVPVLIFGGFEGVGSRFYALRYPDSFLAVSRALGLIFIFCAPELIFGDTELCQVPFSCFSLPDTFSAVRRASSPVFMFCVPVLDFSCILGVGSRFHDLRSQTHFWRCGGRRLLFSCFALPNSFSTVSTASGPISMFCTPGLIFYFTEGVGSHFHILRAETHFRRNRRRRVLLSGFARPNSFLAVPTASGRVFMFCALGHVFGGAKGFGF
jgi:hypothetical protein